MEPRLLLSSPITSPSATSFPISLSSKSFVSGKLKFPVETRFPRTSFFGHSLILRENSGPFGNQIRTSVPFSPIRAVVKRRKEARFDKVIERDKKLKLVLKIRKILVSQPNRVMNIREIGRYRNFLGLDRNRRFIALLRKFPAVFEIEEEGAYSLKFKLTQEAERLYMEEMKIRNGMEDLLVIKLRKLLMMSVDKRITLEKIAHLKNDFGLPMEFRDTICRRYPQYFKVVKTSLGPALELTHWDPKLAVSAAELEEEEDENRESLIIDRVPKFNRVKLPKGVHLSKCEGRRIAKFIDIPYVSPYADFSMLRSGTIEKEKHACGVVHEILSLTVEKRTLVDNLTHFREEFRFSQQLRGVLIRHPEMFYVSLKGDRDSVFLRGGYRDSRLICKDRLLLVKERLRELVNVPRLINYRNERVGEMEEGSDEGDIDDDDDDDDFEDECSDEDEDEDEERVPNIDDEDENGGDDMDSEEGVILNLKKLHGAVFPDGRPRDCW
ncbi:protein WHAT'S THIS FACTOR 1 homolog, chloroplastic-like [Impatiens glandulifera]|uniref:protein WHAT'S THIS FACTOR 1 homolog, chloroplastic-like n=1 Tax=Impatiens glandulifera TaxID=253017 RepID=UPI001FB05D46|nr:protein WHAT'S THIS FACTOR 1 homolog, chloroplastic-like [Impatiens glandulifera]